MTERDDKQPTDIIADKETALDEVAETPARHIDSDVAAEDAEAERNKAPAEVETDDKKDGSFIEELVKIGVKTVAVALSVVMLILSILTVALPLNAMRVFNKLGMKERAMNSGERYIVTRLDKVNADITDEIGNYVRVSETRSLTDADMTEALTVCIGLSDTLMSEHGGDVASAKYFAEKLDKYVRIYLSLNGVNTVNSQKSANNVNSVSPALRPFVYNYAHSLMTLDYEARMYLGKTDVMLYNTNINGNILTTVTERSQTYAGLQFDGNTPKNNIVTLLDGFVDYIDQLSVYLSVVQKRLGVSGLLGETQEEQNKFRNILNGDEFSVFITPENGFTPVFANLVTGLSSFTKYAQAAADFPTTTLDEQLHRLYWLRILASASDRLLNLGRLLYFNRSVYGLYASDITDYYSAFAFDYFRFVNVGSDPTFISSVYNTAMAAYIAHFSA